jgi:hypothetical protein
MIRFLKLCLSRCDIWAVAILMLSFDDSEGSDYVLFKLTRGSVYGGHDWLV